MADQIRSGAAAEATELGGYVNQIIEFIEQMDLPPHLDDLKVIIVADAGTQGVCTGMESYETPREVAAVLMEHVSALLASEGIGVDVMSSDELSALMNPKDQT